MQYTDKLRLKLLELTDSPPDITELNSNWILLEELIQELEAAIENANYIISDDGTQKGRWGLDDIGVYFETIDDEEGGG